MNASAVRCLRGWPRSWPVAPVALIVMLTAPSAGAQSSPVPPATQPAAQTESTARGTAVVRGRVLRADNGQPLANARVQLRGPRARDDVTDAGGRFVFEDVVPGRYTLEASRGGFVAVRFGQPVTAVPGPGTPFAVASGELVEVELALPRGAVINGRVVDDRGQPVSEATVNLLRPGWQGGRQLLRRSTVISDATDDLGEFRIFDIPTGTYVVVVEAMNPFGAGRLVVFHPSTSALAAAAHIAVVPGQEVSGVTVILNRVPLASISGHVRQPDGLPGARALSVSASQVEWVASSSMTAAVQPDGSYRFTSLPSGEYTLWAETSMNGQRWYAAARVELEGADLVVPLTLRGRASLRGRYVFEGADSPPPGVPVPTGQPGSIFAPLEPAFFLGSTWVTNRDWSFTASGLNGRFAFRPPAPRGWSVKRITLGGIDVTDVPLDIGAADVEGVEVLLSQRITEIAGTISDSDGRPVSQATVIVFAEDETRLPYPTRFVKTASSDRNGRFVLRDLPPARYLAVAVEPLEPGDETNPGLLRRLRDVAVPLELGEGDARTIDLRIATAPSRSAGSRGTRTRSAPGRA